MKGVEDTLMIPLWARAIATRRRGLIDDPAAVDLVERLEYDFESKLGHARSMMPMLEVRAAPGAPQNLSGVPGDEQVTLSWDAPSSDGGSAIIRYEHAIDDSGTWIDADLDLEETVPDLTNGQPYPSQDGRGLSTRIGSAWGATQSGVQSLWSRQDASGLVRNAALDAAQRYQVELRYGLDGLKGRARWAPYYIGVESGGGSRQALRQGVTLTLGRFDAALELGQRQVGPGADPEHAVQLRGTLRW